MHILIAEDAPVIQRLNAATMEALGFTCDIASDGEEAVGYAVGNEGRYDLCIMDVNMPHLDGLAATRIIRSSLRYLPILGYSTEPSEREECLRVGMDDFLVKPASRERLFEVIDELTTKPLLAETVGEEVAISQVMPMNADELKELRELKKNGLTKLKLVGLDQWFIVHKNIQNKIAHDLIGEGKEVSEFIDRSSSEPGRCHLYRANLYITKDIFLPEELAEAIRKEDEVAARFGELTDKARGQS